MHIPIRSICLPYTLFVYRTIIVSRNNNTTDITKVYVTESRPLLYAYKQFIPWLKMCTTFGCASSTQWKLTICSGYIHQLGTSNWSYHTSIYIHEIWKDIVQRICMSVRAYKGIRKGDWASRRGALAAWRTGRRVAYGTPVSWVWLICYDQHEALSGCPHR